MPFAIVNQDITTMRVDVIVNAANTNLTMGGGVCGAIFRGAGPAQLRAACEPLAPIATGEAVITPGFALSAKFVIHTAGPVYRSHLPAESEALLRASYRNSLALAVANGCESVAFPLISSGIYGYPKQAAFEVATQEIRNFLTERDLDVFLVLFGKDALPVGESLASAIADYLARHYHDPESDITIEDELDAGPWRPLAAPDAPLLDAPMAGVPIAARLGEAPPEVEERLRDLDEPFATSLLKLIDAKGKTDVEVYKRANLDRKLFSKIRSTPNYAPSKRTALALAIALELNLGETNDLLRKAGYSLSHSRKSDVIVEYFITEGKYDIFEINQALFHYDQQLL